MRAALGKATVLAACLACTLAGWAAPNITGLSPTSGVTGTSVTISGSGFGSTQGTSGVSFNGTVATVTTWSDTSIAVPVPASATTGAVSVTVSGTASNGVTFTVIPKITGISPTSGGADTEVEVLGTGGTQTPVSEHSPQR